MTEQEEFLNKIASISHRIEKGAKTEIEILGKKYSISDTKRKVLDNIIDVLYDVNYNQENDPVKQLSKVKNSDVKIASYLLLNALSYIPFLHAIHWRYLRAFKTSEVFSGIIDAGLNNPEQAFFLKGSISARNLMASRMQMIKMEQK
jgi:hypothetical protein